MESRAERKRIPRDSDCSCNEMRAECAANFAKNDQEILEMRRRCEGKEGNVKTIMNDLLHLKLFQARVVVYATIGAAIGSYLLNKISIS